MFGLLKVFGRMAFCGKVGARFLRRLQTNCVEVRLGVSSRVYWDFVVLETVEVVVKIGLG